MMKKIFSIFLFFTAISSQGQVILSLDSCRNLALKNNYTISNATLTAQKAKHEYKAVLANYLPDIAGYGYALYTRKDLSYNFGGAYLPTYVMDPASGKLVPNLLLDPNGNMIIGPDGNPLFKQYAAIPAMELKAKLNGSYAAGIKLVQPVFTGLKITTATRMAGIARTMADDNLDLTNENLLLKVDEAYWQLVRATQLEMVAGKYLETVQTIEKQVTDAIDVGLAFHNDLLKVQVKVNEARLLLSKTKNGQQLASMNLCNIIGYPLSSMIIPDTTDQLMELNGEDYLNGGDITKRPDYRLLENQVKLKESQVKLVRSDYLPTLGVVATYGYLDGLKVGNEKLLQSSNTAVLAQLTFPLFHWGEGYHKMASAKADLQIAENERDNIHRLMELEKEQYRLLAQEATYRIQLTTKSLEQASENKKVITDRYELGLETLSALLQAQSEWQKAWAEQIESFADYRLINLKYLKANGNLSY